MGFYGNITNTQKSSFSFDKTYSNRYDMDTSCGSDGIYAGRYVLVEYDTGLSEDSYPEYYCYDGQMYGAVNSILTASGERVITGPQITTLLKKEPGVIVQVPKNFKALNLNKESRYIRITSEDGEYQSLSKTEYEEWLKNTYIDVTSEIDESNFNGEELYTWSEIDSEYHKLGAYILQTTMDSRTYNSKKGESVAPELGLWVYVDKDIYGHDIQRYAPLGLGNGRTVDDRGEETWKEWWIIHFGKSSFQYEEVFNEYYVQARYSDEMTYYKPYDLIYVPVTNLNKDTFETDVYYCHNGNDPQAPIIPATSFNEKYSYYTKGLDNECYIVNSLLCFTHNPAVGDCLRIQINHIYSTNNEYDEYWMSMQNGSWHELSFTTDSVYFQSSGDTNYLTNFAIDTAAYGTSRGYDSTVWQKVYESGSEKYVMVAELNSVVPTFDMSADAPTMMPITPHFDSDSTNVYYKIHWQPSWGIRTKAAGNHLLGVEISQTGSPGYTPNVTLTEDKTVYPSDSTTKWRADFYDTVRDEKTTKYYNTKSSNWTAEADDDNSEISAAVYFNLDGFNPNNVAYSQDLIDETQERYNDEIASSGWDNKDEIKLAPTGVSGHMYNTHGNTVDQSPEVDTQELSIMLPSIGDTLAQIWDMVFGGRETNTEIKETNERNTDTAWENARANLDRHGLRLVNDDAYRNGYETDKYAVAEVNTLAGAINSAHDIIGMIITADDHSTLMDNVDFLDEDRIFYDSKENKYYRKHKTYDYTPIEDNPDAFETIELTEEPESLIGYYVFDGVSYIPCDENSVYNPSEKYYRQVNVFTYTEVEQDFAADDFNPIGYYILENGVYKPVPEDAVFVPGTTYYKRSGETYTNQGEVVAFDGEKYYYMDYTGDILDKNPTANLDKMDYIKNDKYLPGHRYYTIDQSGVTVKRLIDGYRPNKYYYIDGEGNYVLDTEKTALAGRQYYDINVDKVVSVADGNLHGIYVPNAYYFTPDGGQTYQKDMSPTVTRNRIYYLPNIKKTEFTNDGEVKTYIEQVGYQEVKPIDELDFKQHDYYIKPDPNIKQYLKYLGSWEDYQTDNPTLYMQTIEYVLTTENTVTIDTSREYYLTGFAENTFFTQVIDKNNRNILKYVPVTKEAILENVTQALIADSGITLRDATEYKAFICGVKTGVGEIGDEPWADPLCPFSIRQVFAEQIKATEQYACHPLEDLYFAGIYHYMDRKGSYILDKYQKMTHEKYYIIDPSAIHPVDQSIIFYEPYKYYYYNTETKQYELLKADTLTQEELQEYGNLFTKNQLYVYEDDYHIFEKGAEWNPHALREPDSVSLATRKERWELKEIPEFARTLNTMHGLLLKINSFLEFDDTYTRDERIANGLLNKVRDLISRICDFIPREFLTVDNYGRLHSTDWDTYQNETSTVEKTYPLMKDVKGDVFEEVDDLDKMRKQWITINLDGDVLNPTLTVHHNFQHVTDTTSEFDMNTSSVSIRGTKIIDIPQFEPDGETPRLDEDGFQIIEHKEVPNDVELERMDLILDNGAYATNPLMPSEDGSYNLVRPSYIDDIAANKITLYTPKVDDMGHIVGHNEHTVTLPFNFKTFHIAEQSALVSDLVENQNMLIADNTQDEFTFASGNKWIKMAAHPETDTLEIGHEVHPFSSGMPNTQYGLAIDQVLRPTEVGVDPETGETIYSDTEESLDQDNVFEVPNFTFDEAGHITQAETHTVALPENFETIHITGSDDVDNNSEAGFEADITADSLIDTLHMTEGNRWINLTANADNDEIIISHYVKHFDETYEAPDFNTNGENTFSVQEITWDNAGHLLESVKKTYTLPYDFKTLTLINAGENVTEVNLNNNSGSLVATNPIDTATIKTGNRWLKFNTDSLTNTWTIYHAAAGTATQDRTKGVHNAQTPNFGTTFTVPTVGIDETGHVATLTESTVMIPLPSLTKGEGNVVTNLTLDAASGAFVETKNNVGNLLLTGYELGEKYSLISEEDSVNEAFSKIQLQVKNITTFLAEVENADHARDIEVTIEPNHTCSVKNFVDKNLHLNFNDKQVDYYAEYKVIFNTGNESSTVSIPKNYMWDGDEPPTLSRYHRYIITTDNISHVVTISKGVSLE